MRIISGIAKGKKIHQPVDKKTRPLKDMVKESIFNILTHSDILSKKLIDCVVLDLFSGVGSFGLEAISRGAKKVIFFEEYEPALNLLIKNINDLSFNKKAEVKKKNIYNADSFENLDYNFDIIFLDPPFKEKNISLILSKIKEAQILDKKGIIIIHRNFKENELFPELKIVEEKKYGLSKILFCKF